jgi:molybdopterin-containing oxidoreductase family iron-sulfur binding subunit
VAKLPQIAPAAALSNFKLTLAPDPAVWDGRMSNNAWLQECPKPFTKEVWGNAIHLSKADGKRLNLVDGDIVRLKAKQAAVEVPVIILEGLADGTIAGTLGYGRTHAGGIGNGVGVDLNRLRSSNAAWAIADVEVTRTGRHQNLLRTQHFFALEGDAKDLQPRIRLAELAQGHALFTPVDSNPPTLYPPHDYDTYKWAMTIDTSACTGCNACVVACQAENNVPVVGPEEIAVGRDMHWLRIDDYVVNGRPGFSPVPCMHCEHAPCEPVCPVAASIHDSEGLNVQVYNRCVGTRFCESNCPYKVRRFNFFGYADGQEYGELGADIMKAVFNPNVTVRGRGVMEKCTYCVQRISGARRNAEKESRDIRDGEVVTACQAACPTRAISFGDLNNRDSAINGLRREPHAYALLGNLGTRPRTTYLARISNPNPDLTA